jgi:hypothetical protein
MFSVSASAIAFACPSEFTNINVSRTQTTDNKLARYLLSSCECGPILLLVTNNKVSPGYVDMIKKCNS